ncbi:unnamed protein product [Alopecurus aequalis]
MATGVRLSGQLQGLGDELHASSEEELHRRPEVKIINTYAVLVALARIGLQGIGALTLLWATVVLLGGFVANLKGVDFWNLTIIALVQGAGLTDAMGGYRFAFFGDWIIRLTRKIFSWGKQHHHERTQLPMTKWLKRQAYILVLKILYITIFIIFSPAAYFAVAGPIICVTLSAVRIAKQDYNSVGGDASEANLKPALNLLYYVSLAHGAIYVLYMIIESVADEDLVDIISLQHGLRPEVLDGYLHETKKMCANNLGSTRSWNLITYGAGLLDSHLPEDCVSGGRVLTMLIDEDISVPITQLLIRSPRQRIQKLIGTLAWRSPAEREMRWFAARIVEHLAGHLNLAQFPGALECTSSLLDSSGYKTGDQEALHLPFVIGRSKWKKKKNFLTYYLVGNQNPFRIIFYVCLEFFCKNYCAPKNGGTLEQDSKQRGNGEQIDEDLVLPGLRILEKLAHDRHNCTLICNTKDLLSRVVAPVSSDKLVEDIKNNAAWTKVVQGSLEVVSRLMGSLGSTGEEMRRLIAYDRNAVDNLEGILEMDMKSNCSIIELQMRAIEVLTQFVLHHPARFATGRREKLIKSLLHIFVAKDWMVDYLKDEKRKIGKPTTSQKNTLSRPSMQTCLHNIFRDVKRTREKEKMDQAAEAFAEKKMIKAQETARRLIEKAGEALAMLSSDSEAIKSFTGSEDVVNCLTEFLNSKIETIKCIISATDTVEIEINTGCRISAAVILKNLSKYVKEPTLRKVLEELLPIQVQVNSTPRCWERVTGCILSSRNDIENPIGSGQVEPFALQGKSHIQQCRERRLRAELLSLLAAVLANGSVNFSTILISQPQPAALEDFVVRLKKMVEDNMYATPACLAIQKLTCEIVIEFIQHDRNAEVIEKHDIIGTLWKASKKMAGLESSMLFAGVDRDCHGVALRPLSSELAEQAEDHLTNRKQALGINTPAPAVVR